MGKPDIKLLALDMDGTSYSWGGEIVKANIKPIQEAEKAGVEVVIATGRSAVAPQNKFMENGLGEYGKSAVIACNGGCIYDFKNKKLIKENPVDTATAKKVFDLPTSDPAFKDVEVWGYVDDLKTVITTKTNKHCYGYNFETTFWEGKILQYEDLKEFNYTFFKLLAFNVNDKFLDVVRKMGLVLAINKKGQACEINAKGINKGSALAQLAKENGWTKDQVMAIGDGENDLPMVEWAGYGVALTNSIPAIKKVAKIQVPLDNEQGGVAYAINKYILGKNVD